MSQKRNHAGKIAAFAVVLSIVGSLFAAEAMSGAAAVLPQRIDLRMLVVTNGDSPSLALKDQLDREGVPYTHVDMTSPSRPIINAAFLSGATATETRANFQGVILPDSNTLPPAEQAALVAYESEFKIREINSYVYPSVAYGLNTPVYSGSLDGLTATVTGAGKTTGAPYNYLAGNLKIENIDPAVLEAFGYLGTPVASLPTGDSFTPFVTINAPSTSTAGSLVGAYTHSGRESLVVTFAYNSNQSQFLQLAHGMITWVTRGVHLGHQRNYLSVHIDDLYMSDARWSVAGNCTPGDDCAVGVPDTTDIRMTPADVTKLVTWQNANNIKLDLAYNAAGSVQAIAANGTDALTDSLLANTAQFRWINHTYEHPYLGCVQSFTVSPWVCATNPDASTQWMSQQEIRDQIRLNFTWATAHNMSVDPTVLVTGEHSGLASLPQMPTDNPFLALALAAEGIQVTASDNSRETSPRFLSAAKSTVTLPRYPMNIFYNVATFTEEVDEYNWIYTSAADGGSGICTNNASSTCITPIPATQAGFNASILPYEARVALQHVMLNDVRPHYAHQSNLAEDRILYPVLDKVIADYKSVYAPNAPIVNLDMKASSAMMTKQTNWAASHGSTAVEAFILDGMLNVTPKAGSVVPVTVPTGVVTEANYDQPCGSCR